MMIARLLRVNCGLIVDGTVSRGLNFRTGPARGVLLNPNWLTDTASMAQSDKRVCPANRNYERSMQNYESVFIQIE
jgi:hypothetical protein